MLKNAIARNIHQLSALRNSYRVVKNPADLDQVIRLSDHLLQLVEQKDLDLISDELWREKTAVEAIRTRYRVRLPALEELSAFPEASLGRCYYRHLKENGITPESLKGPAVHDDITYIAAHLYETHDIWHTLTGFGISVADELGVAAFGAAQFPSQFNYILLSGGLLNSAIYDFQDRKRRMDAIVKGWTMGTTAKKIFGVKWDRLWAKPVDEIRARYRL